MSGIDFNKLKEPFPEAGLDWRIARFGVSNKGPWAQILAYLTARDVEDRLDEVVGVENWKNQYGPGPQGGVMCGLAIRVRDEWIWKFGVAENTKVESIKGGESDAFKRAAVRWGIGRYLYGLGDSCAIFKDDGRFKHYDKDTGTTYRWDPPLLDEAFINEADKLLRVGAY
jgi:hypothetical protein